MFLLSRLLGFVRQAVINGQIGLGPEADAWFAAFRIPDTLFTLFAGGALISAFIPVFTGLRGDDRAADRRRLFSGVLNLLGMVMIGGSLLAALFAPALMSVMVPGFDAETRDLATEATRYLMLSPLLLGISAVFKGALHAERDFLLPAVGPLLYNVGVIAGALLLVEPLGIIGLAWGTIGGALLHLLIQVPGLRRAGLGWRPALAVRGPGRRVVELMLPRLGGFAVIQLSFFFINYLASLQGPSGVAAFANAWMLLLFPLGILAIPYAEAVLPEFSDLSARGDRSGLARATSDSLSYVIFATLPAGLVMIVTGEPLVKGAVRTGRIRCDRQRGDRGRIGRPGGRPGRPCRGRNPHPGVLLPPGHPSAGAGHFRQSVAAHAGLLGPFGPVCGRRNRPGSLGRNSGRGCGPVSVAAAAGS